MRIVLSNPDVNRVVAALDDAEERCRIETGEVRYTGRCGNLSVRLSDRRLDIRGSLASFSGVNWPGRGGVEDALGRLEQSLGTDLRDGRVWRLDVFRDLSLSEPPATYLPLFLVRPRLQRYSYSGTSAGFQCRARTVRAYDKDAERLKAFTGTDGPLRFEVAWLRALAKQMGRPVTLYDLACPIFWQDTVTKWVEEYRQIEKARALVPLTADSPQLKAYLSAFAVQELGLSDLLEQLESLRESGEINAKFHQRRRRYFLDLVSDPRYSVKSDRLLELDRAVDAAEEEMRDAGI